MPPQVDVMMMVPERCVPLQHDVGGVLLQLGMDAAELLRQAQKQCGQEREALLKQALELRLREHAGWLAVRTSGHPNGDMLAAAKAAAGIGVLYLQLLVIESAREWLWRALIECPLQAQQVRDIVQYNLEQLERIAQVRYEHCKVCIHGLVAQAHYNGREGIVLSHKQERWEVQLMPQDGKPCVLLVRPQNVTLL